MIRDAARKTAEREMKVQRQEFEKFGIMADWSKESTYRTLGNGFLGPSSYRSLLNVFRSSVRDAATSYIPADGLQRYILLDHVFLLMNLALQVSFTGTIALFTSRPPRVLRWQKRNSYTRTIMFHTLYM